MSVKERLKNYLKHKGISIYSFEKSIGASNAYVNSITKGIGGKYLEAIRENYVDLNIDWLLNGTGEMIIEDKNVFGHESLPNDNIEKLFSEVALLKEKIGGMKENFKLLYDQLLYLQNSFLAFQKGKDNDNEQRKSS